MKNPKCLLTGLLSVAFIVFLSSCKSNTKTSNEKTLEPEFITEAFTANLTGTYKYAGPDTLPNKKCIDTLTAWRAIVDAVGTSNIMGEVKAHFDFCGDEESHYGNTYAYMVDKDKDTLFIDITGQVLGGKLDDHPEYVTSYWKDPISILGGTGKYSGASGSGMSDDYNSSEDPNSHHRWTGTITLLKQKL